MDRLRVDVCVCVLQDIRWPGKGPVVEIWMAKKQMVELCRTDIDRCKITNWK
jgi:hypothetical protein